MDSRALSWWPASVSANNNVDVVAANVNGVMVSNISTFMEKEGVVEYALALTLAIAHYVPYSDRAVGDSGSLAKPWASAALAMSAPLWRNDE